MSEVAEIPATGQLRMLALSRLRAKPGFNPRTKRDKRKYADIVRSVKEHGVIMPLLVAPDPENPDEFVIVAGETRYLAAGEAALMEVPCVVRPENAETGGLDLAVTENLVREDLSSLDEARAYGRLIEHGLTVSGIAQRVTRSPKHVKDRLLLLELPAIAQRGIEEGKIPLGAAPALATLAGMHEALPGIAIMKASTTPDGVHRNGYRYTWADVIGDPIAVVLAPGYTRVRLPSDVYCDHTRYEPERFKLSEKTQKDLAELRELRQADPHSYFKTVEIEFGKRLCQQAAALNAAYAGQHNVLIVGQDVADELAADAIREMLKEARRRQKVIRAAGEQATKDRARMRGETDAKGKPLEGDALRARRAEQRSTLQQDKERAIAHNAALGAAVLKAMAKLKVDTRVLEILAAFPLGGELGKIAAAGARYCLQLDGWFTVKKLKTTTRTEILDSLACLKPAQTFLAGAKTPAEYAGRLVSLLVMARFADERAVAMSRRSHYWFHAGNQLPWSKDVMAVLDELAAEHLPEHLTERVLGEVRAQREEEARVEAEENAARALLETALADPASLSDDERASAERAAATVHGKWSTDYRAAIAALTSEPSASDAGEDQPAAPASDAAEEATVAAAA